MALSSCLLFEWRECREHSFNCWFLCFVSLEALNRCWYSTNQYRSTFFTSSYSTTLYHAHLRTHISFSAGKFRYRSRLQGIPLVLTASIPDHQALLSGTPDVTLYNHLRDHSPWSWGLHVTRLCTAVWGSCQSLCFIASRITTPFVEFALPFVGNSKRCPSQRLVDWRAPTSVAVLVCVLVLVGGPSCKYGCDPCYDVSVYQQHITRKGCACPTWLTFTLSRIHYQN